VYIILYYHSDKPGKARGVCPEAMLIRDRQDCILFIFIHYWNHINIVYFDFQNFLQIIFKTVMYCHFV